MPARHVSRAVLALALAGAFCGKAFADDTPLYNHTWYLLPQINTMESDSRWLTDHNRVGAGLKLGKPLTDNIDLQFGGSYASEADGDRKYRQTLFGADALWMFSRKDFRPFLFAGVGGEHDKITSNSITGTGKNAPYLNAGFGAQWVLGKRVFLQGDGRYIYGFLDKDEWGHDNNRNWLFSLGLGFHFGDPPAAAPAVVAVPKEEPKAAEPAPEPAPAPKPAAEKVTLAADTLFDYDKAVLRDEGKAKLNEFGDKAKQLAIEVIVAVGHTDRLGSDKYNQPLSERRAAAVKEYLVGLGIDPNRVYTEGKGKTVPVSDCKNMGKENGKNKKLVDCLQPDRRVEIEVIGTRQP